MKKTNQIVLLEQEKWQDYSLPFSYTSHHYYDVEILHNNERVDVSFVKKPFETPFVKPLAYSKLFQPMWDDIKSWGIVENERLVAVIETFVLHWNNRLKITELWVDESYRRMGVATQLMNIAVNRAKEEKRRAIILEVQSCNQVAIDFYLKYGFKLIGFDLCSYGNCDIKNREVRIEMGMLLHD